MIPLAAFAGVVALGMLKLGAGAKFWPGCFWFRVTGWHCPGCGNTRAVLALLDGDVLKALGHNFVGILAVVVGGLLYARYGWISFRENRWTGPVFSNRAGWVFLGVAAVWMGLRNLPWEVFSALAP